MKQKADVCLLLEGTYPYVVGGVSNWAHELIQSQDHLTFSLVAILAPGAETELHYQLPDNIINVQNIYLQELPVGKGLIPKEKQFFKQFEETLLAIYHGGNLEHLKSLVDLFGSHRSDLGSRLLLNSESAWQLLLNLYNTLMPSCGFLDYFWSWRALVGGLCSILLVRLPDAGVYHALCTGYAGLLAARAHLETGKPSLVTEHGIYTNERRIEISSADWLSDEHSMNFNIDDKTITLRDFWINTFKTYSLFCYEACEVIVTLFDDNKVFQIADGAEAKKLIVIPNAVDIERFSAIEKDPIQERPTIALIGRVVPIKDVKTFIRACEILKGSIPNLRAYILGPIDEDEDYLEECKSLIEHLLLEDTITLTGEENVDDFLGSIDVCILTSISEAQPLVILEAGVVGIPSVATNVGACKEMLLGRANESPPLGAGGAVVSLSNPKETAAAAFRLLKDQDYYNQCSIAISERVRKYYDKKDLKKAYYELYGRLLNKPELEPVEVYTHRE